MKPGTFADYVCAEYAQLRKGWMSGAAWEGHAQVVFDEIVRKHLSDKVGIDDVGDLTQDWGNYRSTDDWADMREQTYPLKFPAKTGKAVGVKMVNNTVDLLVKNNRFVWDAATAAWVYKTTKYYVELKCESRKTNDFGGTTWMQAWALDRTKLKAVAKWEKAAVPTVAGQRRRYWMVMIGFSPANVAAMKGFIWDVDRTTIGDPQMFIGIDEIIN